MSLENKQSASFTDLIYWNLEDNQNIKEKCLIQDTFWKMEKYLSSYNSICVSISGGSDSDIMLHTIATYFRQYLPKIHFVFSNTGLEYRATKEHLDYLEDRYMVSITRLTAANGVMPVPLAVREFGIPFVSKRDSEMIERLQKHGFDFKDESVEELLPKYPKCKAAIRWWCNDWGEGSRFNINRHKGLKENIIENGFDFKVSSKCCEKSKKNPMKKFQHSVNADLILTGERKSEGGCERLHIRVASKKAS